MGLTKAAIQGLAGGWLGRKTAQLQVLPLSTVTVVSSPAAGFLRAAVIGETAPRVMSATAGQAPGFTARVVGSFGSVVFQTGAAYSDYSGNALYSTPLIGPGESITLENTDPTFSIHVNVEYVDFPDTGFTLARVSTAGMATTVLIPAAPVGKVRIVSGYPSQNVYPPGESESAILYINRDDVPHGGEAYNNAKLCYRIPAGSSVPGDTFGFEPVAVGSGGALTFELTELTNSVEGLVVFSYYELDVSN